MAITIVDSNALEWVEPNFLTGETVITDEVLEEIEAWKNAEQRSVKYDGLIDRKRSGILFARHNMRGRRLQKFNRQYGNSIYRFDNAIKLLKKYGANPSRVYTEETGEFFKQFRTILTKTLAYEAAKARPELVKRYMHDRSVLRELTDVAMQMYRDEGARIAASEFGDEPNNDILYQGIAEELCNLDAKQDRVKHRLEQICMDAGKRAHYMPIPEVLDVIEKFHNGVTADLQIISAAYDLAESTGEPVRILSDDLDIREAVEYISAFEPSGYKIEVVGRPNTAVRVASK